MCHKEASKSQKCDEETGQCPCRANVKGLRCTECKPGYFAFPDCKDCKCDPDASIGITCGKDNGKCDCKPTATGPKCEFCKPGYWKHPECIGNEILLLLLHTVKNQNLLYLPIKTCCAYNRHNSKSQVHYSCFMIKSRGVVELLQL